MLTIQRYGEPSKYDIHDAGTSCYIKMGERYLYYYKNRDRWIEVGEFSDEIDYFCFMNYYYPDL
jgi:hypothetical protein